VPAQMPFGVVRRNAGESGHRKHPRCEKDKENVE